MNPVGLGNNLGHAQRYVLHADFDAFCVAVERVCNPSLRGRPVIVGGAPPVRGVVMSASSEARAAGIVPGWPVSRALRLCRDAVVVEGHGDLYRRASEAVIRHLRHYTPKCESSSIDDAYLELTGMHRLFGSAVDVGARLRRELNKQFRLDLSVGVASNKLVSKVASDMVRPHGIYDVPPGQESAFLAPLPVERLPGVGTQTADRLAVFNIDTIRELAASDVVFLERLFGRRGRLLHAHAQGLDDTPVGGLNKPTVIEYDHQLTHDSNDQTVLDAVLFLGIETVAHRLRTFGLLARRLTVAVRYVDSVTESAAHVLPQPTEIDGELYAVSLPLLHRTLHRRIAVRRICVRATRLSACCPQIGLFGDPRGYDRQRALMTAIDRIRDHHGDRALMWGHVAATAKDGV
ncbi:MAG: DNA polymerase IV [Candidatus Zixiibacteriota bacterium]